MNLSVELISSEINLVHFKSLYERFLNISKNVQASDRRFIVHRYCKVNNLDVKLMVKLEVSMDFFDNETTLHISSKLTMSSDNISLRRYKTYINDSEYIKSRCDIVDYMNPINLESGLEKHIKDVIQNLQTFRVCQICRILYKDSSSIDSTHICNNCIFDHAFYFLNEKCIICQEGYVRSEYTFSLTCGHVFHSECILQLFLTSKKRECPICKEIDNNNS